MNGKLDKDDFTIFTLKKRLEKRPDLFLEVLGEEVQIEKVLEKLDSKNSRQKPFSKIWLND